MMPSIFIPKCLGESVKQPAPKNKAQEQSLARYGAFPSKSTRTTTSSSFTKQSASRNVKRPVELGLLNLLPSANSFHKKETDWARNRMVICKPERPTPATKNIVKTKLSDKDGDMVLLKFMNLNLDFS